MVLLVSEASWGTPVERERRRRIQVAVWAYAYEVHDESLVPDAVYDRVCREVDVSVDTGRPDLDAWFRSEFDPSTGFWVHSHPDRDGALAALYRRLTG